jgi:hypothetical protein
MRETFRIGISDNEFAGALASELSTPGVTPLAATSRFFYAFLVRSLAETMVGRLIKEPLVTGGSQWSGRYETLAALATMGTEVWYPELRFSTRLADAVNDAEVVLTGMILKPVEFGFGENRLFQLKTRLLKTQANHELRLLHVVFPAALFGRAADLLKAGADLPQPYIANPEPHGSRHRYDTYLGGYRTVAFDHLLDGNRLFCSCARTAHDLMRAEAAGTMSGYAPDSWPHRIVGLLTSPTYRDGICHLCVADQSGPEAAAQMYGDNIQVFEDIYIDQLIREGQDKRTATAEIQRRLGISRWKSEAELHQIVKAIFPDVLVQREASPPWLGRQRLDIYMPTLKLAIEYQGAQHFSPVAAFGGEAGFARARERDELKKNLCEANGIELVYVHHGEALTAPSIRRRLGRFLTNS